MRHRARLGLDPVSQAATLCKAVAEGRIDQLRLLLRAGANVNAADYDGQTALHVAAADGNLPAVSRGAHQLGTCHAGGLLSA